VLVVRLSALSGVVAALFFGGRPDAGATSLLVAAAIAAGLVALGIAGLAAYGVVRAALATRHRAVAAR
jgi:hypothetical protein